MRYLLRSGCSATARGETPDSSLDGTPAGDGAVDVVSEDSTVDNTDEAPVSDDGAVQSDAASIDAADAGPAPTPQATTAVFLIDSVIVSVK